MEKGQQFSGDSQTGQQIGHSEALGGTEAASIGQLKRTNSNVTVHRQVQEHRVSLTTNIVESNIGSVGATTAARTSPAGASAGESMKEISVDLHIPTDEMIGQLNSPTLEDDIEQLVKQGFEALIRNDDAEKSTLDFVKAYKDEESSALPKLPEEYKDAKSLSDKVWENVYYQMVVQSCKRHLEDHQKVTRALARMCQSLASKLMQQNKPEHFLSSYASRTKDVLNMGDEFVSKKMFMHAVVSYFTAAKLHYLENKGDETLRNIEVCLIKMRLVVGEITEQESTKTVVIDHIIPLMRQMIELLQSTENTSRKVIAEHKARSLLSIGACFYDCGKYQESANECKAAAELMEIEFREAETYRV